VPVEQEIPMEVFVKTAEADAEREAALNLRATVFLDELHRDRPVETDKYDASACHVIALFDTEVVGALRVYTLTPSDRECKIGRVAVDKRFRGAGIGAKMMDFVHAWAKEQGFDGCYLHAQIDVRRFYEKLGYSAEGEAFVEAGTDHIRMRLRF